MQEYGMKSVFIDKKQREITIHIDDDYPPVVTATHDDDKIGHLEFIEYKQTIMLSYADVDGEFQNAGIASQMLREVVELLDEKLYMPNPLWLSSSSHPVYLTQEGKKFIESAIKQDIIDKNHVADYDDVD